MRDGNPRAATGRGGAPAATGPPRREGRGGRRTGYGNRPYEGSRVFARLLYRF